ncbi:MAG: caspase family protein [Propylenella sp.]
MNFLPLDAIAEHGMMAPGVELRRQAMGIAVIAKTRLLCLTLAIVFATFAAGISASRADDPQIREIQSLLSELGYNVGAIDGVAGQRTRVAIQEFLADEGANRSLSGLALLELLRVKLAPANAQGSRPAEIELTVQTSLHSVLFVTFSPDGRLAVTCNDSQVRVWDVESGTLLRIIRAHSGFARSVAVGPDGQTAFSGGDDGSVKFWNLASGRLIRTYDAGSPVYSVAVVPDGRTVLAGTLNGAVISWNAASGQRLWTFETGQTSPEIAIAPDGRSALSASGKLNLLEVNSGRLLRTFDHLGGIDTIAYAPDGLTALSGGNSGTILWEISSGRLLRDFEGHTGLVRSIAFAPDGRTGLSASWDNTVKLWDIATGELLRTMEEKSEGSVAYSPDGMTALSGSDGAIRHWEVASGKLLRKLEGNSRRPNTLNITPDGRTLLSGMSEGMAFWDTASGRLLRTIEGLSGLTAVAPDGQTALSSDLEGVKLWDLATGSITQILEGSSEYRIVAFSPDGQTAASKAATGPLKLWDVATGRLLTTFPDRSDNHYGDFICFAPDGRTVLLDNNTSVLNSGVQLWNVSSGRLLKTFPEDVGEVVHAIDLAPDGRTAVSAHTLDLDLEKAKFVLRLWDFPAGSLKRSLEGHSDIIVFVEFAPDGETVLSGSIDGTLKQWRVADGKLLDTLEGHTDSVNDGVYAPDGGRIYSASTDGTVRVWNASDGSLLATMIAFANGEWLTMTPEGFFDASENGANSLNVARGFEFFSIDQVYDALYRPDLVEAKLAGDPEGKVREAAAQLDLAKVIESGAAPEVSILGPEEGADIDDEEVEVSATVTDQGGGIGRIEWRINGVTLGLSTRGLERVDAAAAPTGGASAAAAAPITVSETLTLEPGDNRIEIVAYNAKDLIASEPVAVTVRWDGASSAAPPRLHVLAVGIDDYWDGRLRLSFAASDATAIGEGLRSAGATMYESVEVTTVLNATATAAQLDAAFARLGENVRPRDVFVFFLAGHGKTLDGRYYFLPQDFRYEDENSIAEQGIGQDQFQEWLARVPARKSVLLYDTCESGTLTGPGIASRGLERVAAMARMTRAMGRTVLAASTDDAPALEGYRGHGVFTYALLDALGKADRDTNETVEVTELAAYVDRVVPELSYAAFQVRQVPQMNLTGSDFPVGRVTALLGEAGPRQDAPTVPRQPTHVLISASVVHKSADRNAPTVVELPAGSQVRLVETAEGWTLIARDGETLGYVEAPSLLRLQ